MFKSENTVGSEMGPLSSNSRISSMGPLSPRSLPVTGAGAGMVNTPRAVNPAGTGSAVESIIGFALSPQGSRSQNPVRVDGYRSASPARRAGGGGRGPVEIGPGPSQK
jgi:hypothetical protein